MAKRSVPRRKAKPSPAVPPEIVATEKLGTNLLVETALILDLGAKSILTGQDEVAIPRIVKMARRTLEEYVRELDDADDRTYQALGVLVLIDRALAAEVDLESTSLVDPLRNAMEAVQSLLEAVAGVVVSSASGAKEAA